MLPSPKESRVKVGRVHGGHREAYSCGGRQSPAIAWLRRSLSKRLPLQAGAMWLQQRPLGLADEENDAASCGSGLQGGRL